MLGLGCLWPQAMCISPSFLTATAIPSHISHPFLCVPLEPPSWWSCLTFKGPFQHKLPLCVHGLPSLHPSAPNASSPPSSSLCLWEPSPADPFPTRAPSSWDLPAGAQISISLTAACSMGSASQRQGQCLGQDLGQGAGKNLASSAQVAANHLWFLLNEKQVPWRYCPTPWESQHF